MTQSRRDEIKKNVKGGKKQKHPGHTSLTEPLTPKQAHHIAASEARAEYGPVVNAIKGEREGSKAREKQIGEWFGQLGTQANEAAQATDASYAAANNSLLAHGAAGAAAAQGMQGQIAGQNAQLANLTGADPSLFAPIAAEQAGAAGQRQITNQALAAPIAQAGASEAGFLRGSGLNARREGIQQRMAESKRRQKIKQDLTSARKERAQKTVGNFHGIRGEERDYSIQQRAFPLKEKELAASTEQAAADRRLEEEKFGESQRHNRATEKNSAAGNESGGGLTPAEKQDAREGRKNAMTTVRNLYTAAKKPPQTPQEWAAFTQLVAQEEEISPTEAQWAVKRFRQQVENAGVGGTGTAQGEVHR